MKAFLNSTKGKITFVAVCFAIIFAIFSAIPKLPTPPDRFSEKNESQKITWLRNELQNSIALNRVLVQRIKAQFKYPEEVEFLNDEDMITFYSKIQDANTGTCFNNGDLVAKNAFGVKSKYYWEVKFILTDSIKELVHVKAIPY